jgi:hypothetical protein
VTSLLRDTEQLFWKLISAPEGVAAALRQDDNKSIALDEILRGDERLTAVQRLDIYANMYFYRLLDILRTDYEAVVAAVGDAAFHNLVTDYLLVCPSLHPSVRNVGQRLPQFLDDHALGRERPWLGELARLERARIEVFDGPDAEPLTLDELRTLAPEDFVALKLPVIPNRIRLEVGHAVDDFWRAVEARSSAHAEEHGESAGEDGVEAAPAAGDASADEDGAEDGSQAALAAPTAEGRVLLVWRHELLVYHRPLESIEDEALARAAEGATFGAVCDLVSEHMALEEAGPFAFQLLARWVQDGLIARTS